MQSIPKALRLCVCAIALSTLAPAYAQVSVGIDLPGVNIGVNFATYPQMVVVPGYPVYYSPQADSNYFFYDGMYWVYERDNWYASSWYNGPWGQVAPEQVPYFVLRVPVRYYRQPPAYFHGWASDAPPRWGDHWGNGWQQGHANWDTWNHNDAPRPAPLPVYQRQYSGNRYPQGNQQQVLESKNYHYQPQDAAVQQRFRAQAQPAADVKPAAGAAKPGPTPRTETPTKPPARVVPETAEHPPNTTPRDAAPGSKPTAVHDAAPGAQNVQGKPFDAKTPEGKPPQTHVPLPRTAPPKPAQPMTNEQKPASDSTGPMKKAPANPQPATQRAAPHNEGNAAQPKPAGGEQQHGKAPAGEAARGQPAQSQHAVEPAKGQGAPKEGAPKGGDKNTGGGKEEHAGEPGK